MFAERIDQNSVSSVEFDQVKDKISLFGGLTDKQVSYLVPHLKEVTLDKGDVVFKQSQLPCNVYIVLGGEVKLEVQREDGTVAVMRYKAGDCFGETAVIGIQPQLGLATAQSTVRLLVLSRTCLLDMANIDAEMFGILMMNVAREVSRRLHSVVTTSPKDAEFPILRA